MNQSGAIENSKFIRLNFFSTEPDHLERGVYAASSFGSLQANRFTYAIQTLKRPEVRAPGAVPGCAAHDKPGNLAKRVAVE